MLLGAARAMGPFGRLSAVSPDSGKILQADRAGGILSPPGNALDARKRGEP